MSEDPEGLVLRYLPRLDEKVDDLIARVGSLERTRAGLHIQIADVSNRMDRFDRRLEHIERRLDLVEGRP